MGETEPIGEQWLMQPPPGARVIDTGYARYWREAPLIVCAHSYAANHPIESIRIGLRAIAELGDGKRPVLLSEAGPLAAVPHDSRALMAGPEGAAVLAAVAVVVRSPVARVITNFFVRFSGPPYPVRAFDDLRAARAWAESVAAGLR